MKKYYIDKRKSTAAGFCGDVEFYDEKGSYLVTEYKKNNFNGAEFVELKKDFYLSQKGEKITIKNKLGNTEEYYTKGEKIDINLSESPFKNFKQEKR